MPSVGERRAVDMLASLVMAAQGVGHLSLRDCIAQVYEEITSLPPDEEALRWITGEETEVE